MQHTEIKQNSGRIAQNYAALYSLMTSAGVIIENNMERFMTHGVFCVKRQTHKH